MAIYFVLYQDYPFQVLRFCSHPEVFLRKDVLKVNLQENTHAEVRFQMLCNFIEIARRHGCSAVNLLCIFRTPFPNNTSGWLLLYFVELWNAV